MAEKRGGGPKIRFGRRRAHRERKKATPQDARNTAKLAATTEAPTGVDHTQEAVSPAQKHTTAVTPAQIMTPRKLLNSRMAVRAGKITREEISMAPIIRMPSTMVRAVSTASRVLYRSTFSPWPGKSSRRR